MGELVSFSLEIVETFQEISDAWPKDLSFFLNIENKILQNYAILKFYSLIFSCFSQRELPDEETVNTLQTYHFKLKALYYIYDLKWNSYLRLFAVELNHASSMFFNIFQDFNNSITNSHSLHASLCSIVFQVWQIAYKLKTPTV